MAKAKFLDMKNIVTSLKGIGVGIVTSLIVGIPLMISRYVFNVYNMPVVALILGLLTAALYLLTWGYFAKRFWGWK